MTKQHIPKIRFQGFNDEWEKVNLSEIAPIRSGYSFKSKLFKDSGIPIVRISNILSDGTVRGEFVFYDEIPNDNKYLLQGKSILIAMSGATTGKVALLNSSEKYYQNQRVGYFKEKVDISFVYSILSTGNFVNQLSDVLVAGAQPNISAKDINNFNFLIPNTLPEQESIGQIFRTLDDLISAYKENLEHYQSLKTSMLSKMFPKEGQKKPEIRLDGFDGDWEEKKLKDIAEFNPKSVIPNEFNYVDLESVIGTTLISHKRLSKDEAPSRAQRTAKKNDIFFSNS
ncbi:MAG: restriction endonuclease subunit S [Streptococcus sp.]|nr:restriction endonuclease subunit S [Streptococcus sp.]